MAQAPSAALPTSAPREFVPVWHVWLFVVLAAMGVTLDLWTKWWMFETLDYPGGVSQWEMQLPGVRLRFQTSINEGALWGIGQGRVSFFAIVSILAFGFILCWLFWHGAAKSLWLTLALASVSAGTLGNLYDRLGLHECRRPESQAVWYGVRDFIDARLANVYDWPVFNLADVMLVAGAIALAVHSLVFEPPANEATLPKRTDASRPSSTS